jgi:IS5 family transposase
LGYLQLARAAGLAVALWQANIGHYRPLMERIIAQSERRVLGAEPVPAAEKLVSLFEPHADIIRNGREVAYGHKLNLTTGRSGLILDWQSKRVIRPTGGRLLPMLERHIALYGKPPRQAAADGSYASHHNLVEDKTRGVRDMAFHKKVGLRIQALPGTAVCVASPQLPRRH